MIALSAPLSSKFPVRRVGVLALAIGAAGLAIAMLLRPSDSSARPMAELPPVELPSLTDENSTLALPSNEGRPMVINFFAAWCEPCRRELPLLADASEAQEGSVDFVGIDHQDSRARATEMLRQAGVRYPAGYDREGALARKLDAPGMPFTLFVDEEGRIVDQIVGELSQEDLDRGLAELNGRKGMSSRETD